MALWRFASGEADILIAPVQTALWRMRDREFYRQLARTIERDQAIPLEELLEFLASAGYDKQITCEMPGQYAVRGGIIDIFSPELRNPFASSCSGDTIESIRAFDPNTQRSTNPVERATLMPLDGVSRGTREVLERMRVSFGVRAAKTIRLPAGFYPGWEFRGDSARGAQIDSVRSCHRSAGYRRRAGTARGGRRKYRAELAEAFEEAEDPLAEPPLRYIFDEEEWALARQMVPRLGLEHLGVSHAAEAAESDAAATGSRAAMNESCCRPSRPRGTTGTSPHSWRKCAARVAAGEHVMISAASTGELERFADISHEYRVAVSPGRTRRKRYGGAAGRGRERKQRAARRSCWSKRRSAKALFSTTRTSSSTAMPICSRRCHLRSARDRASEDREFLQRFLRPQARRLCRARGSRHRPIRRPAAGVSGRRERRIHAAALCGRREALRSARAARSRAEVSVARRGEAHARPAGRRQFGRRAKRASANPSTTWRTSCSRSMPSGR